MQTKSKAVKRPGIDSDQDAAFAEMLVNPAARWCRARLLHALANAAKQGVLDEVIDELLDDDESAVKERLYDALARTGWIR